MPKLERTVIGAGFQKQSPDAGKTTRVEAISEHAVPLPHRGLSRRLSTATRCNEIGVRESRPGYGTER